MINKIINFIKESCKNNEQGCKKRKNIFMVGIVLLGIKVFFKSIYKISKWVFYVFGEKGSLIKKILILCSLFAILFFCYNVLYKNIINYL